MRLVIRNQYGITAGGLRRYNGRGIFSFIRRKLFFSGLKKITNVVTKANVPQKIADPVGNGAQSAGQKIGKAVGQKVAKFTNDKIFGKQKKRQTEQQLIAPPPKLAKIDFNHLIDV